MYMPFYVLTAKIIVKKVTVKSFLFIGHLILCFFLCRAIMDLRLQQNIKSL